MPCLVKCNFEWPCYVDVVGGRCRNIRWRKTSSRPGDKLRAAPANGRSASAFAAMSISLARLNARFHVAHRTIAVSNVAARVAETTQCRYRHPKSSWTLNVVEYRRISSHRRNLKYPAVSHCEHECDVKGISGRETIDNPIVAFLLRPKRFSL